jgi:Ca2+-binding EF-hand superfamily protein
MKDIKQKVTRMLATIDENDNNDGFVYFDEMLYNLYSTDPDYLLMKEKLDNLVVLMYEFKQKGEEEYEKFLDMDFEDEIWHMI